MSGCDLEAIRFMNGKLKKCEEHESALIQGFAITIIERERT